MLYSFSIFASVLPMQGIVPLSFFIEQKCKPTRVAYFLVEELCVTKHMKCVTTGYFNLLLQSNQQTWHSNQLLHISLINMQLLSGYTNRWYTYNFEKRATFDFLLCHFFNWCLLAPFVEIRATEPGLHVSRRSTGVELHVSSRYMQLNPSLYVFSNMCK
jgi:hypothetical protein